MPVTITEIERSGSGEDSTNANFELRFHAVGSNDYNDVANEIASSSTIPILYRGLPRIGIYPEPIGGGHWFLSARYGAIVQPEPPQQLGDAERITWASVSTTVRRTHATVVGSFTPPGGTVPDNGDAIHVTDDGVEGVDIDFATARMTIRQVITNAQASTGYGMTLASACRKKIVNSGTWRGFSAGEARFVDFSMESRGDGNWDLTRVFDVDVNVTGGTFAGVTGISKKAHEYMWALTQKTEDVSAKRVVEEPVCVYVHQVYEEDSFAQLEP